MTNTLMIPMNLERIFINQFGAIKPPWISSEVFYKLPFNFCDRWCERCQLSSICRVYQKEKEREKRFIEKGVDPKSLKAVFESVKENFIEVKKMLEKDMKRLNITLTKEDIKREEEKDKENESLVECNKLYYLSRKLSRALVKLVEDINFYYLDERAVEVDELLEILTYYMHFFSVKIYRALLSEIEEREMEDDTTSDSKTSAFLAYIAITKIIYSLKLISTYKNLYSEINRRVKKLIYLFNDINGVLVGKYRLIKLND